MNASWESYLRERFPGYLLPESAAHRLSAVEAARFLRVLSGRSDGLELLRGASLLSTRAQRLREFVDGPLAHVVSQLPSCTLSVRQRWSGAYHGRLAIRDTVAYRVQGDATSFVTLTNQRSFDLPENVLLRHVCGRLLGLLALLREADVMREGIGWAAALFGSEGQLSRAVVSSVLARVRDEEPGIAHVNAARSARHVAYHEAAEWLALLHAEFDDSDEARIAKTVATGALLPLSEATRFEVAVMMKLGEVVARELQARQPGRWRIERGLVRSARRGREDVYACVRDDGVALRLFYNSSILPMGEVDLRRRYYLQSQGRLRPDVTISFERDGARFNAVVIECKCSSNAEVLSAGFNEAALYRHEYREHLLMKPKALLVVPGGQPPSLHPDDDVAVESWSTWPSNALVHRLVETALS